MLFSYPQSSLLEPREVLSRHWFVLNFVRSPQTVPLTQACSVRLPGAQQEPGSIGSLSDSNLPAWLPLQTPLLSQSCCVGLEGLVGWCAVWGSTSRCTQTGLQQSPRHPHSSEHSPPLHLARESTILQHPARLVLCVSPEGRGTAGAVQAGVPAPAPNTLKAWMVTSSP